MCDNKIFHNIRKGIASLFSTSDTFDVAALTEDEKKQLIKNWLTLKENNPNVFCKAWVRSAQMSINIKKATLLREDEDPESNERFLSLWPYIENFVDKLILEFHCDQTKVIDACQKLGARHVLIKNFHTNFWDIFLGNLIQIMIDAHPEKEQKGLTDICKKFFSFVVSYMRDGYKKRSQEQLTCRRRMNVSK